MTGKHDPSFVTIHIDEYDKLGCCKRLLEIIAVGDSADPVSDANDELVAHGFWNERAPQTPSPVAPTDSELAIRRMLCAAYAGAAAYMDDGEAQDNRENPCIDFLRDSAVEIHRKMFERRFSARAAVGAAPNPEAPHD